MPTLASDKAKLKIPPGAQTGKVFRLKGKGIANVKGYGLGDEMVRIVVETPTNLTSRQKELLQELARLSGDDAHRFLEVTYASGEKETLYFKDFVSGALIESVCTRAKKIAVKRLIASGAEAVVIIDIPYFYPEQARAAVERARQLGQSPVGQRQRVAAAQNDFPDRRIGGDIGQRRLPAIDGGIGLSIGKVPAETVAAMHRAGSGRSEQHTALILVQHPGHGHLAELEREEHDRVGREHRDPGEQGLPLGVRLHLAQRGRRVPRIRAAAAALDVVAPLGHTSLPQ